MQELIDEHSESLSTEFVRVAMEACQQEHKEPTTSDKVWVRLHILQCISTYDSDSDGEDAVDEKTNISSQTSRRQVRITRNGYVQIKEEIDRKGTCGFAVHAPTSECLWKAWDEGESFFQDMCLAGLDHRNSLRPNFFYTFTKIELLE